MNKHLCIAQLSKDCKRQENSHRRTGSKNQRFALLTLLLGVLLCGASAVVGKEYSRALQWWIGGIGAWCVVFACISWVHRTVLSLDLVIDRFASGSFAHFLCWRFWFGYFCIRSPLVSWDFDWLSFLNCYRLMSWKLSKALLHQVSLELAQWQGLKRRCAQSMKILNIRSWPWLCLNNCFVSADRLSKVWHGEWKCSHRLRMIEMPDASPKSREECDLATSLRSSRRKRRPLWKKCIWLRSF